MRHRHFILIALIALIALVALVASASVRARADTGDSMPRLVSTTGGNAADTAKTWSSAAALKKAADAGDPDACYELGAQYLSGSKDFPQNATRAMLCFEDAARKGHGDAAFRLGKMYADGDQIPRDYAKAVDYYTAAARAGNAIAQHNLGAMRASGRGVKRDYAEGLAWLIIAARHAPEAADSEKKLRAFLTSEKQSGLIAAGEARALELTQELAGAKAAPKTGASPADPADPASSATGAKPAPIKIEPVKISVPAPQMTPMPITPMPLPALPPPPAPPPATTGAGN